MRVCIILFLAMNFLVGCAKPTRKIPLNDIENANFIPKKPRSAVRLSTKPNVHKKKSTINRLPKWAMRTLSLKTQCLPFNLLIKQLIPVNSVIINYEDDIDSKQPITLNYSGSIKGALDTVAAMTNYHYIASPHQLTWSPFKSKTFTISFLSNTNAQIREIKNALEMLKSPAGKIIVSKSTSTATVVDRPENVATISNYLQRLNQQQSQQIAINIQVLEVAAYNTFYSTIGQYINSAHSANEIIDRLRRQYKLSVLREPQIIAMNNQLSKIRIEDSQSSINPGKVIDDFTLRILPKIQDNKVYMQVVSSLENVAQQTQQSFKQQGLVRSGSTLVLTKYKRQNSSNYFGVKSLPHNTETLILITPTIIYSDQPNVNVNSR